MNHMLHSLIHWSGVAHLHGYKVDSENHPRKKHSFSLVPPESKMRSFHFAADNETDKKRLVQMLLLLLRSIWKTHITYVFFASSWAVNDVSLRLVLKSLWLTKLAYICNEWLLSQWWQMALYLDLLWSLVNMSDERLDRWSSCR